MSVVMTGNYIFVEPGAKAYKVASNFTNYVELGVLGHTNYYLEAKVESDAFLINATLLDSDGKLACSIVDNFPQKAECQKQMTPNGYRIVDNSGLPILTIQVQENICLLKGQIYCEKGQIIAQDVGDDFLIYRGPAVLGKSGPSRGIVLE